MKRLYFCLLWLLVVTLCQADPILPERAMQIAASYAKSAGGLRKVVPSGNLKSLTPGAAEGELLYIFDRGEGEGFVIVSGDDCMPEILGYTDQGDFIESEMPPALLELLDGYRGIISKVRESGVTASPAMRSLALTAADRVDIAPLVKTHWHQDVPYNNLCPMLKDGSGRSITGCTATAASQIIYYWHKDNNDRTLYDTPTYSYGDAPVTVSTPASTPIQWDLMQLQYGSSYPAEMGNAVARLMTVVGTSLWQVYGRSTSGEMPKVPDVMGGQFGLNATFASKSSYTTESWERMIYNDLLEGHPIQYAGSHPTNGGHSVVLDGYQASTNLFHFNFGWGGQGDGYFTVDDANGMNGFNQYQSMVYKITPRKLNLEGRLKVSRFMQNVTGSIRADITNHSTLDYKGVYLFCLSAGKPSSIGKATCSDTETLIPQGGTATIEFTYKPLFARNYTLYLVDKNLQILDQVVLTAETSVPDLELRSLSVNSNGETATATVVEGAKELSRNFQLVQNTDATVSMQLYNGKQSTYCEPSLRCLLYAYNHETSAFEQVKTSTYTNAGFSPDEQKTVSFSFTGLEENTLYKAAVYPKVVNNSDYGIACGTPDSVAYFKVLPSSLSFASPVEGEVKVEGGWNDEVFRSLATDSTVSRYDLTAVRGVNSVPVSANRNALYYVADDAPAEGLNVVKNGVCEELSLTSGYNFQPREDFRAIRAGYVHHNPSAVWGTVLLPFDCEVPRGIMARRITQLEGSAISACDSVSPLLRGGTPYMFVASADRNHLFTAREVTVSIRTPNLGTDSLCGTFVNLPAVKGMGILNYETLQSFVQATGKETVAALTAYLDYPGRVICNSRPYRSKDAQTLKLARAISAAYVTLEAYAETVPEQARENLEEAIAGAEEVFTAQPPAKALSEAYDALNAAVEAYAGSVPVTSEDGATDLTALLQNPSFESGTLTGWQVTSGASSTPVVNRVTSSLSYFMSGADGSYVLSVPEKNGTSAEVCQNLEKLDNGFYRVKALLASDTGTGVCLFANDRETVVEGSDFGPMYFTEATVDEVEVTDGTLVLGVRKNDGWYKADYFRLYYLGDPNPVEEVRQEASSQLGLTSGEGWIRIISPSPCKVCVYNLQGVRVTEVRVEGEAVIENLPSGLYLVDGHKVMVR